MNEALQRMAECLKSRDENGAFEEAKKIADGIQNGKGTPQWSRCPEAAEYFGQLLKEGSL